MSSRSARSTPATSRRTSRAARPTSTSRPRARPSMWPSRRRSTRRPTTTSSTGRASPRRSWRRRPTGSGRLARTWTGRRSPRCSARRRRISTPRASTRSPASVGSTSPPRLTVAPAAPDPQEPNEDVTYVKPGGFLHRSVRPLTAARRKSGSVTARVDVGDDPRDVYRIWVPGKRSAAVALQPTGGDVDLALWGPRTASVLESGGALRRDTRGISERKGTKRERLRVRTRAARAPTTTSRRTWARAAGASRGRSPGVGYRIAVSIVKTKTARR